MVQLTLPKNSIPVKGKSYSNVDLIDEQSQQQNHDIRIINVYRWSGDENTPPQIDRFEIDVAKAGTCLLYTSPSPRDTRRSRMPSSA